MRKRSLAAGLLLLALGPASVAGLEIGRYREQVDLQPDGSAVVGLAFTVLPGGDARLRIPLSRLPLPGMAVSGLEASRARIEEGAGGRFLSLDLPVSRTAPLAIAVSFRVAGYFAAGGPPTPFGVRELDYRFVNLAGDPIASFTAVIRLPVGSVIQTVDDVTPKPAKAGSAPPYSLSREYGRHTVTISLTGVRLGDGIAWRGTFRNSRKSSLLFFGLFGVALFYLLFFRDGLKGRSGRAPGGNP